MDLILTFRELDILIFYYNSLDKSANLVNNLDYILFITGFPHISNINCCVIHMHEVTTKERYIPFLFLLF